MFIGHLGVGLALKKVEPRLNLGWLFAAAMLLDIVLWVLVLAGIEQGHVPTDYAQRRYLTFVFPYSHSLIGALGWSALMAAGGWWITRRRRAAAVLAVAVFSHWVLDVLVHPPELPLAGAGSPRWGLSLWNHLSVALGIEALLLAGGWWLYFQVTEANTSASRYGLGFFLLVLQAFAFGGQMWAPPPSSMHQLAISSLVTLVMVIVVAAWLDRKRRAV